MSNTTDTAGSMTPEQKRELLARLLQEKARQEVVCSPLSYGQRSLWFMYQLDPTSAAYNIMYAARLRPDFDRAAFRRAFQALINRHAVLRTTYGMEAGAPVQKVHAYQELPWDVIDARQWSWDKLQEELQFQADIPFELEEGPVIRVLLFERPEGEKPVVLFVVHHIALDFWSFDLLFDELEALYRQEVTGRDASLWPQKIQ
ncbi:MAG: non-ribosomal peptide synthetase, partial [Planctomycetales bacterium]|nr:non-ribosomal peptide synthetase [Planctomycetales bacterium]